LRGPCPDCGSRNDILDLICPAAPGRIDPDLAESAAAAEVAAVAACAGNGVADFKPRGFLLSKCQRFGVSPDGIDSAKQVGLEVKEVNSAGWAPLAAVVKAHNTAVGAGDNALVRHLQTSRPGWLAQIQLGMAVTGHDQWVLAVRHRSSEAIMLAVIRRDLGSERELVLGLELAMSFVEAMQAVLPVRWRRVVAPQRRGPAGNALVRRPNRRQTTQTGCPGRVNIEVRLSGNCGRYDAVVTSCAPCDGSHSYAAVDIAPMPDRDQLLAIFDKVQHDGATLAALHRTWQRVEERPLPFKALAYAVGKAAAEARAKESGGGQALDDQARYLWELGESGNIVSHWSIGSAALDAANGRSQQRVRKRAKSARARRDVVLVVSTCGANYLVPPGWLDKQLSIAPNVSAQPRSCPTLPLSRPQHTGVSKPLCCQAAMLPSYAVAKLHCCHASM
jgi:hypothetical protein